MESQHPCLEETLPHRSPVLLLTSCAKVRGEIMEAEAYIDETCLFLRDNRTLEHSALIEIMAQCFASGCGLHKAIGFGYLAQVKKFVILKEVFLHDRLRVQVQPVLDFENIVLVRGEIFRAEEKIAGGEFKVFHPKDARLSVR